MVPLYWLVPLGLEGYGIDFWREAGRGFFGCEVSVVLKVHAACRDVARLY